MEKEKIKMSTSSEDVKLIHVKVIGGNKADVYEIGKAMKNFSENAPFELHAIVTNENVELQDVDTLLMHLYSLKKSLVEENGKKSE